VVPSRRWNCKSSSEVLLKLMVFVEEAPSTGTDWSKVKAEAQLASWQCKPDSFGVSDLRGDDDLEDLPDMSSMSSSHST